MKLTWPPLRNLSALLGAAGISRWMATLDAKVAYYDRTTEPVYEDFRGPNLYVFWHEYILLPLALRGHNDCTMLISRHGGTDILQRIAGHMGFSCVRGSSSRGGVQALRELISLSGNMNLTMTPDGPRGPRRVMSPGPIYLATKLGLPLVQLGFGYDRPWRMRSWDRFAVPRPGSRARMIMSPPIRLPGELDRDGLEHYRLGMESMLNRLTDEAEAWAESGTSKIGETPMLREPRRWPIVAERSIVDLPQSFEPVDSAALTESSIPAPHLHIDSLDASLRDVG